MKISQILVCALLLFITTGAISEEIVQSVWVSPAKLVGMVARTNMVPGTTIYMDYGSEEMYRHAANLEALISMAHMLMTKHVNLAFRIVPGGTHSEASWEKQIPIFMECLGI